MSDIFKALTRIAISSGVKDLADERLETIFWERFGNAELEMQRHICIEIGKNRTFRDAVVTNMLGSFINWVADYFRAQAVDGFVRRNTASEDSDVGLVHAASLFGVTFDGGPEVTIAALLERHGFDSSRVGMLNARANQDHFRYQVNLSRKALDFAEEPATVSDYRTTD